MREIYISQKGDDNNPGTLEAPFSTLARANEEANKGGVARIVIRGGTYCLNKSFELKGVKDLEILPYENEEVRITGAYFLDNRKVKAYKDKILQYNLKEDGIDDYGAMKARGFRRPYVNAPMELFINREPLYIVRYPKNGTIQISEVLDPGSIPRKGDFENRGGTFRCDCDRIFEWKNTEDLWLNGYFGSSYADDTIKVSKIDSRDKTITLGHATMYGLNTGNGDNRFFYALNVFEELSQPGEYYIDRLNGIIYFYPPEDSVEDAEIAVSMLEEPMFCIMNCSNVSIKNLTIEMCRGIGIYMEEGSGNRIEGCTVRNAGVVGICIGKGVKPDTIYRHNFTGEPASKELGSWHEHIYENTQYNRMAGENHLVADCRIYNTGAGGIHMGGGDRATLTPANNTVKNCEIYKYNRWDKTYKAAINIDGVGNKIIHCHLHDSPGFAIYLHGNDHLIEYNEINNVCSEIDDGGAFYMGRDPSERGIVIRYNYFHDIISVHDVKVPIKDGFGVFAVYNDDGASGIEIYGNLFYRAGNWAIANNGGSDIKIVNNIFIQSSSVIWHTDNYFRGKKELDRESIFYRRLLENVDITKEPYITRYPELSSFFDDEGYPKRNVAARNVVFQCLNFITTWHRMDQLIINAAYLRKEGESQFDVLEKYPIWYEQYENLLTHDFPSLKDRDNWDFEKINKEIRKYIPGFEDIPFEKMGLCRK